MEEIWKDIKGYEDLYQVSNLGRIKSLVKGKRKQEIIMKQQIKRGYFTIRLSKKSQKKDYCVHRIVAESFISNPNKYPQVNHKDENKLNNNFNNLEWCTVRYNNCYGTRLSRVSNTNKLRKEVIKYDLNNNYLEQYNSVIEASKKNNVNVSCISACCRGIYKQVKGNIYKFKEEVMPNVN